MMFRDNMRVDPSRMELEIINELKKKKLNDKFERDYAIVFFSENACRVLRKESLTLDMIKRAECYCFPDFLSFPEYTTIYFGIDGPRHLTPHNSERDNKQNRFMKALRIKYIRFAYKRYSKGKMKEIIADMIMYMENPELEMDQTIY